MDLEKAEKALDDYRSNGGMSIDDLKKELGLDEPNSTGDQIAALPRALGKSRSARFKAVRRKELQRTLIQGD